jgi:hypothetical protein
MFKIPPNPYRKQQMILLLVTAAVLAGLLFLVPPSFVADVWWPQSYTPLLILVMMFVFLLILVITNRWKKSLLWAVVASTALWLRLQALDTWLNVGLLISFLLVFEYYWKLGKSAESA